LGSLRKGDSLYGINEEEFKKASPTIVLTQSLCDVCAPSANQVAECLPAHLHFRIINLEPRSLDDVADSFKTISSAIVKSVELGESLATQFYSDLKQITSCVRKAEIPPPTCVMLEWTEPLFDGGHWVPDMMRIAGASYTLRTSGEKSRQLTPTALAAADPDCIIVACCGYDLRRNIQDGQKLWNHSWWRQLRAVRQGRVFAADGNRYFARPGPSLVGGAAILARCVYDGHDQVGNALHATSLVPPEGEAWARLPPPVITQIASSGPQKDENNILCPGDAKVT
jgi:iron complex transport system substrate-binding protein